MVVGYSGSGKSTLARALSAHYGVPALHLDAVQFRAGWQERPREEQREILGAFLDANGGWVVDGNYTWNHFERRLEESDRIVLMLFPRLAALWRVVKRYHTYKGKVRPDMGEGCAEKLDWAFVRWVLWEGRGKKQRTRWRGVAAQYPEKCVVLRSQRQIDRWMKAVGITT